MKYQISLLALGAALAAAAPAAEIFETRDTSINRRDAGIIFDLTHIKTLGLTDTVNDWKSITTKDHCPAVAAIFARGTFDSGNIGVFVGPELIYHLKKDIPNIASQGVDPGPGKYPATLIDYVKQEGGSKAGAQAMADQAIALHKICGTTTVILWFGWSQGAIVARKALGIITDKHPDVAHQIAGLGTFGDPYEAWEAAAGMKWSIPAHLPVNPLCVGGLPNVDFLCAPFNSKGYKIPTNAKEFLGPWGTPESVAALFRNAAQGANGVKVLAHLTHELLPIVGTGALWPLLKVVFSTHPTRAMLVPVHFTYGDNGMAEQMAKWAAERPMVKASIAAHGKKGGKL